MSDAADHVRRFIAGTFRAGLVGHRLGDTTPLFSTGIIDSFGVLQLIVFLEDTFCIEVDTARHELAEFDTIAKIVGLVSRLRETSA